MEVLVLVLVIDFLLIKVSAISFTILLFKSIGNTLINIEKVSPILSQKYQSCDVKNFSADSGYEGSWFDPRDAGCRIELLNKLL